MQLLIKKLTYMFKGLLVSKCGFFLQKLFNRSDLNQSGSLSDNELQKAIEAQGTSYLFKLY